MADLNVTPSHTADSSQKRNRAPDETIPLRRQRRRVRRARRYERQRTEEASGCTGRESCNRIEKYFVFLFGVCELSSE